MYGKHKSIFKLTGIIILNILITIMNVFKLWSTIEQFSF